VRTTQYYELLGYRALYHDGWKERSPRRTSVELQDLVPW
jgi:hypothetical protein